MNDKKIAVFIDADNAPARKIENILETLAEMGSITIKRAYGNWKKPELKSWEEKLHCNGIQPIQQFDLVKGKNASDIAICIDMMDILLSKDVDIYALVTSDCDFTPMATRVQTEGKIVVGFGQNKTPEPFVNSCTKFVYLDRLSEEKSDGIEKMDKMTGAQLKGDTKLINLIRKGIASCKDDDGWAMISKVGSYISNLSVITPENYGYKKISDVIKAIDLFDTKKDLETSQTFVLCKKSIA